MAAIIGTKLGMTQIFGEDGSRIALTVIQAGPCHVTQVRTEDRDGYAAIQLGYGAVRPKLLNKPKLGHLEKAGAPALRHLHEFTAEELDADELSPGDLVTVGSFEPGQLLRVTGTSKGKGYAGTIKRHNFSRGPVTHGSHNVRQGGSIGAAADPARVFKGTRMSGRMGGETVTQRGVQVVDVDPGRDLLFVKGAIPGSVNGIVVVRPQ